MLEFAPIKVITTLSILGVYFAVMFYTAFIFKGSKMTEASVEEYAVGSRSFGWILVMFCYIGTFTCASMFTAWLTWTAQEGLISFYLVCYSGPCFIFMYLMANKVYIWGKEYKMVVMPDFVQVRYNNTAFTKFFALMALAMEAPWVVMEFYALGSLLEAITYGTVPHRLATIIIALFVLSYVFYSGMRSIVWTELIQGILSSIVVGVFVILMAFKFWGGFGPMLTQLYAILPDNLLVTYGTAYDINHWSSVICFSTIGTLCLLSYFTRIFTARNSLDIKKSSVMGGTIIFIFIALTLVFCLGILTIPGAKDLLASSLVFFGVADMAYGPIYLGLLAVIVVAAGMSLISTVLSSHSITISEIFLKGRQGIPEAQRLRSIRTTLVVYTLICLAVSLMNLPALYTIALFLGEGLLQFIPMMLFGCYWKKANLKGAAIGFSVGLIVTYSIYALAGNSIMGYTGGIFGFLVNIAILVGFGLGSKVEPRVEALFELAKNYNEYPDDAGVADVCGKAV